MSAPTAGSVSHPEPNCAPASQAVAPSPQAANLAQRLTAARRRRFVGRANEIALFEAALDATHEGHEPPFALLHLFGPGGVGKTTLLHELAHLAQSRGRRVIYLDGRDVDASPAGLLAALGMALEIPLTSMSPARLAEFPRLVLLLDTYEALVPLDSWLRNSLLVHLPISGLVVCAGRNAPDPAWRTDLAWSAVTRIHMLDNFSREEGQSYLRKRGLDENTQAKIMTFTHCHPLALSLVADLAAQNATPPDLSEANPNLLRILLELFIESTPGPDYQLGLEICAHVRMTTEALLENILGAAGAPVFAWLRTLCFIEQGAFGIFPHDLARDVLDADLHWRNPIAYLELHQQIRAALLRQFSTTTGPGGGPLQQQIFLNLLYLHRFNPLIRPYYDWSMLQPGYMEPAQPADHDAIVAIAARHQGNQAAALTQYWLQQQPTAFQIARRDSTDLLGFMCVLQFEEPAPHQLAADPVLASVWRYIQETAPLVPGQIWLLHRFWFDAATGQKPGLVYNLVSVASMRLWSSPSHLSWTALIPVDASLWEPALTYIRHPKTVKIPSSTDAPSPSGEQICYAFMHDWRAEDWAAWLAAMGAVELAPFSAAETTPPQDAPFAKAAAREISEDEFTKAVRLALRDFARPDALAHSPLLHSRLLQTNPVPTGLQALLAAGVENLASHPRDVRLYRALFYTYLEPVGTQERVAEFLDLPFSTYRHHLNQGLRRVTDWLWQQELQYAKPESSSPPTR